MKRFENKVVLITGGTSGMGLATAEEFISEGATVIITGRYQHTLNKTIEKLGPGAFGIESDTGRMTDVMKLREQVKHITPVVDVLFVNAGFGKLAPVETVTEDHFDELFNMLVKGGFFTVQQLLPLMRQGSSIIFNTSIVTGFGMPNFSVYSAAKSAIQSFVKTMAAEFSGRGIRVNSISPGYITTNIFSKTGLSQEQIDGIISATIPTLPMLRFGQPEEIARTVSFLASDSASYIHGTEISVDGGYSIVK